MALIVKCVGTMKCTKSRTPVGLTFLFSLNLLKLVHLLSEFGIYHIWITLTVSVMLN